MKFTKSEKVENKNSGLQPIAEDKKPFVKMNIILMGVSILLIIVGFVLMTGDGSSVEGGFNPDIFSTRRIVVGPTLSFIGFLAMAFSIIYSPKRKK